MAQSFDMIRFTLTFSAFDVPAKKLALTQALHTHLVHADRLCMIRTGWAHDDSVPVDVVSGMEIAFIVPKGALTESQTVALGHILANSIGETLVGAERSDVDNYPIV